jgi:hypothetical protein
MTLINNIYEPLPDFTEYGSSMETYLTDMLTEELSKEIDKQIIEHLMNDPVYKRELEIIKLREDRNKKIIDIFGVDFIE